MTPVSRRTGFTARIPSDNRCRQHRAALRCYSRFVRRSRLGFIFLTFPIWAQSSWVSKAVYLSYEEARPILRAMAEILPPELKSESPAEAAAAWSGWVERRDSQIRARLAKGDEDSLLNLLLFGTSFTRQPRISLEQVRGGQGVLPARAGDLIRGLASPGNNERLLFLRSVVESKGYDPSTPGGRSQLKQYLLTGLERMLQEDAGYAKRLEAARGRGDATQE